MYGGTPFVPRQPAAVCVGTDTVMAGPRNSGDANENGRSRRTTCGRPQRRGFLPRDALVVRLSKRRVQVVGGAGSLARTGAFSRRPPLIIITTSSLISEIYGRLRESIPRSPDAGRPREWVSQRLEKSRGTKKKTLIHPNTRHRGKITRRPRGQRFRGTIVPRRRKIIPGETFTRGGVPPRRSVKIVPKERAGRISSDCKVRRVGRRRGGEFWF